MSEHAQLGSRAAPPASTTLDEAILALRATRGDASEAVETLERIEITLERPSAMQRAGVIARLSARSYNGQVAAVVGIGLLLATTSYAAFFGLPAPLASWLSAGTRAPAVEVGAARSQAPNPRVPMVPPSTTPARPDAVPQVIAPGPARSDAPAHAELDAQPTRAARLPQPGARRSTGEPDRVEAESTAEPAPADLTSSNDRDRLYTDAHRLHFVVRDYPAALHAWERYLRVAGDAPLAVEARYNRALCLVRIGDHSAARAALGAIARGEEGAYRQREARALLRVLR